MSDVRLNLTRKWRAKGFDQIIGQDLTVRILKNSLYVGNYFPVYLLWGQRGSGKTSTARIFAAAINCRQLNTFRSNPNEPAIPCLSCDSCKALLAGKHPDFIEMDAASHTGVDHVRQIIDAASLMPLLGHKKIYLIDEAHMLSKAAFNAFLKILEEPPASVLFMLATTDPEKIIETVKSRCFQLFFKPVSCGHIAQHLAKICTAEDIEFEHDALHTIGKESGGSVRDAINLLEQVRFSESVVTKAAVITSLGYIEDEQLLKLFVIILNHGTIQLLPFLQKINIRLFSAEHLWSRLLSLVRSAIWLKHGLQPTDHQESTSQLNSIIQRSSLKKLTRLLEHFYNQEPFFLKTTDKHLFLEILLLQACQDNDTTNNPNTAPAAQPAPPTSSHQSEGEEYEYIIEEEEIDEDNEDEGEDGEEMQKKSPLNSKEQWTQFINSIDQLDDPLLSSIFKQSIFSEYDEKTTTVTVKFNKEFIFFNEWLDNSYNLWHPLLQKAFVASIVFNPLFTGEKQKTGGDRTLTSRNEKTSNNNKDISSLENRPNPVKMTNQPRRAHHLQGTTMKKKGSPHMIDVSNVEYWKKTNMLLRHFPGVVSEVL